MVKKRGLCVVRQASAFLFLIVVSVFSNSFLVMAAEQTSESSTEAKGVFANDVDTIIIVNGGDVSGIDSAIASGISHDIGVPVLYTSEGRVSDDLVKQLESGIYKEIKNVVILGGEAVVSPEVEKVLENSGATLGGGFEVTRIAGTTGTRTAVEAINYFYGPEAINEVSLVKYEGDGDKTYDEVLQMSAQLGRPIIPIPNDVNGLPADVSECLHDLGVNKVNFVGDFAKESEMKGDLNEMNMQLGEEISGSIEKIEEKLYENVKDSIETGDKILFIEKGDVPPIVADYKVFYYKDENNDNIDDDSGAVLDGIGRGLIVDLKDKGIKVDGINYYGDDSEKLKEIQKSFQKDGVNIEIENYDKSEDLDKISIDISKEEIDSIVKNSEKGEKELQKNFELYKGDFEKRVGGMIEQFKAFYINEKEKLSSEELRIGAQIIDEANKGDSASQWKLMNAFASEYNHENYISSCRDNSECVKQEVELEKANVEEKLEKVVGIDRAKEVANLDVGEKIGLLDVVEFGAPGKIDEVKKEVQTILSEGNELEDVHEKYVERNKEEMYKKYADEMRKEYESLGRKAEADKITIDSVKKDFDNRMVIESEAYLGGFVKAEEFKDPVKRAEIYSRMTNVQRDLEANGIKDTAYMTPADWRGAYDKYSVVGGKLNGDDFKRYEAAITAYKTYENMHQGVAYTTSAGNWDSKTGQYSYLDPEGKLVSGVYKEGKYYYNDEEGKLVEGRKDGTFKEYNQDALPSGWKYDSKTGAYSKDGANYIPPSEYNSYSGKYEYYHSGEGKYVGCTGGGCATIETPNGYVRNSDGSWSREDYKGEVNKDWKPGTYYDPKYEGYIPAVQGNMDGKYVQGGDYTGGQGTGAYTDPYGNAWNQKSDGTWTQGSQTGTETTATSNYQAGATWTKSSDGSWVSSTGQTYSPSQSTTAGTGSNYYAPGTPTSGGTQVDSYGNTWTQSSDGTWTGSGGGTTGTSTGSYSGGTSGGGGYSGGSYTGGTTGTGTGGGYSGGTTGSYSGGGYSGGTSGGGGSYSGGDSGGGSAPSGGGDSGGGGGTAPSGGVIMFDPEGKSRGLLSWLIGGRK